METNQVENREIKDSGERREFESGAVRDIQVGKGRCDLLPLDVVGNCMQSNVLKLIEAFKEEGSVNFLHETLDYFFIETERQCADVILEVSKHFEAGAKKYGDNNWQRGIPTSCYVDSAVRHYLKFKRGDTDENHDRAFVWNVICCIWTCQHIPHLNSYKATSAVKEEIK